MLRLEDLQPNTSVQGILPKSLVMVVIVQRFGSEALEPTYKTPTGKVANELLCQQDKPHLKLMEEGRPRSFDRDGALFHQVSEAQRIRLLHLFDPDLADKILLIDPLPHKITVVYEAILAQQSMRFLLALDPGKDNSLHKVRLKTKKIIAPGY